MQSSLRLLACALSTLCLLAGQALAATPAPAPTPTADDKKAERIASWLADELAQICPLADAADQAALDRCRQGLSYESKLKTWLPDIVLWGRQKDVNVALKASGLNQFSPDMFASMYLPLFMFNGEHSVEYVASEKQYRIHLRSAFRNRLPPGQFPYPFWHEDAKWSGYEKSNEVVFWWGPAKNQFKVVQWSALGATPPLLAVRSEKRPTFDGQWMWTDAQGQIQPKVTVFDGLFEPTNPHLARVEATYKALALRLRESQCNDCHVPSNPDNSNQLVMLQTPAHAAGQIKRLLKSVREDKMPRTSYGIEQALDPLAKAALLEDGVAFDSALDDAKRWEAEQGAALRMARSPFPRLPMPALTDTGR